MGCVVILLAPSIYAMEEFFEKWNQNDEADAASYEVITNLIRGISTAKAQLHTNLTVFDTASDATKDNSIEYEAGWGSITEEEEERLEYERFVLEEQEINGEREQEIN